MNKINRQTIIDLLERWKLGQLTEIELHEEIESFWERGNWPQFPREDPRSILVEVLSQLDILNHQLIAKDDIPAIIEFLHTPKGKELEAWKSWKEYWASVDYERRKQLLKHNPYYST